MIDKKVFEDPSCEVTVFEIADIIASSSGWDGGAMPIIELPDV